MKKVLEFLFLSVIVVIASSCNIDEEITTSLPPKIHLDSDSGIYTVKQGREVIIAPSYDNVEGATYSWKMDGRLIGNEPSLTFIREECGEYYIDIIVTTDAGSDSEEIRVDVVELEIPLVTIAGSDNITVAVGSEVKLNASVRKTSLPTTFAWSVNDEVVSEELAYTFEADALGTYTVVATAANEDGSHSDTMTIEVVNPDDMPFVWVFDREAYHTVVGRKLRIAPSAISDVEGVAYAWSVEGAEEVISEESSLTFVAESAGEYRITATATAERGTGEVTITRNFVVTVFEEGAFYRPQSGASTAEWNKVFDYTPAPGQFINELKTGGFDGSHTTAQAAITYAEGRLKDSNWISLGGFGGYVIVGFDHSIDNTGDYDFGVIGNAFDGSSEPGVVWVMQDENGNGLPDDTWYELAGSESDKSETIRNYAVTYYRPSGAGMPVQWTDNMGNSGEIDYLSQFHTQDYYYPLWIEEDSYTLVGTRLEARNYDKSGNGSYWVQPHYDWGYADNFSPSDFKSSDKANLFKISNAVDFEGKKVNLTHIDFVKVQCAVNAKSGWLGELSTEVCGFYDCSLKHNK